MSTIFSDGAPPASPAKPVKRHSPMRSSRWAGLAFLVLPMAFYAAAMLTPMGASLWYSFWKWDGHNRATWVGFNNYLAFVTDPTLTAAVGHVLVLVVFFAVIPICLGLLSAALITRRRLPGMAAFRFIYFLPQVLTSVVVALVFKRLYGPDGPINQALRAVGLDSWTRAWLGDFDWALPALGLVGTWGGFGFCMVLFISGISSIPHELYEAARVDGAGPLREFFTVTLPGLRGQIAVAATLTITGALRTFDLVWITTRGGPGTATLTPAVALYKAAFQNPQVGLASAIGIVMAVVCLLIAVGISRIAERD